MGGGSNIVGNPNNLKEVDSELSGKIRPIELVKHNPQVFYLSIFDLNNAWEIAGGLKTCAFALVGGMVAYTYFMNG